MSQIVNRKAAVTSKFIDSVFSNKTFHTTATTYGLANEKNAKQKYLERNPTHHLHDIGLVINPQYPFLAASPDARICTGADTIIAEIKCPYSARDMTIEEACQKLPNFCLAQNEDDANFHLKKSHEYWTQIQGQLLITGAAQCMFIVYTRRSLHTELISPCNETMSSMFQTLYTFYDKYARRDKNGDNTGSLELVVYSEEE